MRLFAAMPLPEVARLEYASVLAAARESGWPVRWVRDDTAHITLKFFGEVPPDRLEVIAEAVAAAELQSGELRELVRGCVGNPAALPRLPEPLDLAPRVPSSCSSQRAGAARVRGVRPLRRDARVEEAPERRGDRIAMRD